MSGSRLTGIEIAGYHFQQDELLDRALTHRSHSADNNERLELLGDAILDLVITRYLFDRFPDASEGQLSQLRSNLVKKDTLARLAKNQRLGDKIKLGGGELKSGAHRRSSILADALEALIAAVYIDSGYQLTACETLIFSLYSDELPSLSADDEHKDYKTRLQEWLQARKKSLPRYSVADSAGKDHQKSFTVHCHIPGISEVFSGTESSKRKAEQLAARQAFEKLSS